MRSDIVRTKFVITSDRVNHYADVIEHMAQTEIERCKREEGFTPTPEQIAFLKKELVRYATIRHDIETAMKIRIKKSNMLVES